MSGTALSENSRFFFRPFGARCDSFLAPTAYAVGCILPPLRGLVSDRDSF